MLTVNTIVNSPKSSFSKFSWMVKTFCCYLKILIGEDWDPKVGTATLWVWFCWVVEIRNMSFAVPCNQQPSYNDAGESNAYKVQTNKGGRNLIISWRLFFFFLTRLVEEFFFSRLVEDYLEEQANGKFETTVWLIVITWLCPLPSTSMVNTLKRQLTFFTLDFSNDKIVCLSFFFFRFYKIWYVCQERNSIWFNTRKNGQKKKKKKKLYFFCFKSHSHKKMGGETLFLIKSLNCIPLYHHISILYVVIYVIW